MDIPVAMRTRLYVDGYNLHYGCLKGSPYQWLDLCRLFDLVLPSILHLDNGVPTTHVWASPAVKYFTAPAMVREGAQVIHKPIGWYARPERIRPVLAEAIKVKRSAGAALKWLNQPCVPLQSRRPSEMTETDAGTAELWKYMKQFVGDSRP